MNKYMECKLWWFCFALLESRTKPTRDLTADLICFTIYYFSVSMVRDHTTYIVLPCVTSLKCSLRGCFFSFYYSLTTSFMHMLSYLVAWVGGHNCKAQSRDVG